MLKRPTLLHQLQGCGKNPPRDLEACARKSSSGDTVDKVYVGGMHEYLYSIPEDLPECWSIFI
jgi:hypothetical protein